MTSFNEHYGAGANMSMYDLHRKDTKGNNMFCLGINNNSTSIKWYGFIKDGQELTIKPFSANKLSLIQPKESNGLSKCSNTP